MSIVRAAENIDKIQLFVFNFIHYFKMITQNHVLHISYFSILHIQNDNSHVTTFAVYFEMQ